MNINEFVNEVARANRIRFELRKNEKGEIVCNTFDFTGSTESKIFKIDYCGTVVQFYEEVKGKLKEENFEPAIFDFDDFTTGFEKCLVYENKALIEFKFSELFGVTD
ncbi:MAG: hypothetical protein J5507_00595 [Clostridia bacterium]|nr:hypothetical protein [Clostridia bacterium]